MSGEPLSEELVTLKETEAIVANLRAELLASQEREKRWHAKEADTYAGLQDCADALAHSRESERALRQKLTSLESVDKQLTDARESEKRLAEALDESLRTFRNYYAHAISRATVDEFMSRALPILGAYREAGRGAPLDKAAPER